MKKTRWPGNWKVTCHVCGMWYSSGEIKERWDGLLCCPKDWETRHPQTLIKISSEVSVPDFVSKDSSPDTFIFICGIDGVSAYADMATADCAKADNTTYPYSLLVDLGTNGHGGM